MKTKNWRLIIDKPQAGRKNMAVDYALLKSVSSGMSSPVIRFYRWDDPTITIGYFQKFEDVVNIENTKKDGIELIRRLTGGGAVYHDMEITYTVIIPLDKYKKIGSLTESSEKICSPIVNALKQYSLNAVFEPANNILIDGKKVSGSAQARRQGVLLQHGTILLGMDREKMFQYLKIRQKKPSKKKSGEKSFDIVSLQDYLGKIVFTEVFHDDFINEISSYLQDDFKIKLTDDRLTSEESLMVGELSE